MKAEEIPHIHVELDEVDVQENLKEILAKAVVYHHHLCPRQVLGARLGLAAGQALGFDLPRRDKKMLVFVETDGCFVSGVQAATGCNVNRRTLRIVDYGKIALTAVNVKTGAAVRVIPQLDVREKAWRYAGPDQRRRYFAMLEGYQTMPDDELLTVQTVELSRPIKVIVSRPGLRSNCAHCGEEIINERERLVEGVPLCVACAGPGYYSMSNEQWAMTNDQ